MELLGETVVVPRAVVVEVLAGPADDPVRKLAEAGRFRVQEPIPVPDAVLEWGLGAGESAVLAVARSERSAEAVLDDAQARRCARALAVGVVGTLGLVIRAARLGIVDAAAPIVRDLRAAGLRVDDALVAEVLRRAVGESWEP